MILGIVAGKRVQNTPVNVKRYWRLLITLTRTVDDIFATMAEMSLHATANGPNLIAGSTTGTASSSYGPDNGPNKLVDGNITTIWASGNSTSAPQWVQFDLGVGGADIHFMKLTASNGANGANRMIQNGKLQWSANGTDWNDVITITNTPVWGVSEQRTFTDTEIWVQHNATGAEVTQIVPAGMTKCEAYLIGAGGGGGTYPAALGPSGAGGYTVGTITVTPGETLSLRVGVGGQAGQFNTTPKAGGAGGFPGGGNGAFGDTWCGGGGGYSAIFRGNGILSMVAGGGGGGTGYSSTAGAGGGTTGGNGNSATGGTQSAGGSGTYPGSYLQGGRANGGNRTTSTSADCGGGGGGYYGGAAPSNDGGTGGGGSGYIHSSVTNGATYAGSGQTRPTQIPATINGVSTAEFGVGRAGNVGQNQKGGDGAIWIKFTA